MVASIVRESGRRLSQLATLTKMPQTLRNIRVERRVPIEQSAGIVGAVARAEEALRARGRVFLRYSGTEPLLRILVEGPEGREVHAIADELEAVVRSELAGEGRPGRPLRRRRHAHPRRRRAHLPGRRGRLRRGPRSGGAEAEAVAAVRALVLERPESRDAERIPLYLDTLLAGLGLAEPGARRRAAGEIAAEHRRANLWSKRAEGSVETLDALRRRGYRIAVVSNADGRVRGLLEAAGLAPHLEFVVDSAEVGVEKPDPRIFHAATERLGLPPAACAYVGDIYEIDVVGAERAGPRRRS